MVRASSRGLVGQGPVPADLEAWDGLSGGRQWQRTTAKASTLGRAPLPEWVSEPKWVPSTMHTRWADTSRAADLVSIGVIRPDEHVPVLGDPDNGQLLVRREHVEQVLLEVRAARRTPVGGGGARGGSLG